MEKQISITKVSIIDGMFLKLSYKEHLPDNDERSHPNVTCSSPVHADLLKAFADFKPHLALISEEISNNDFISSIPEDSRSEDMVVELGELVPAIKATRSRKGQQVIPNINATEEAEEDIMDRFRISTVEFKVTSGVQSIILYGEKRLSTYKWMGLGATPPIREDDSEYKFNSDLLQLAEVLKYEVSLYMLEHKYAPPAQKDMFEEFGDGAVIEPEQY